MATATSAIAIIVTVAIVVIDVIEAWKNSCNL